MNSILQCLSNTKELRDYCLQNQYLRDLNNNSRMRTALISGTSRHGPCPCAPSGTPLQHCLAPPGRPLPGGTPMQSSVLLPSRAAAGTVRWVPSRGEGWHPLSRRHRASCGEPRAGC